MEDKYGASVGAPTGGVATTVGVVGVVMVAGAASARGGGAGANGAVGPARSDTLGADRSGG